jgi:hypothetical protein
MVKSTLLTLALLAVSSVSYAQAYTFSQRNETYVDLESPDLLSDPVIPWLNEFWTIPIGFDFQLLGNTFNEVTVYSGTTLYFSSSTLSEDMLFAGFSQAVVDKGLVLDSIFTQSPISIAREGEIGSRILKVEFKNLAFLNTDGTDSVNVQIWLYENGKLETHIGNNLISGPDTYNSINATGPVIGIISESTNEYYLLYESGDQLICGVPGSDFSGLSAEINTGTVFEFTPLSSSVTSDFDQKMNISIDKTNQLIEVSGYDNNFDYIISDVTGRVIQAGQVSLKCGSVTIPYSIEQSGIYFLNVRTANEGSYTLKFYK